MIIEGKRIWQHAAGDRGHSHVRLCLDYDVILIGPGAARWKDADRDWQRRDVVAFCSEMRGGGDDIVILKLGLNEVYGVGVVGEYQWCNEFNDVDGWNLGHTRRVRWLWNYIENNYGEPMSFHPARPLTRSTTQRTYASLVMDWLKTLNAPDDNDEFLHSEFPKSSKDVTGEDIAKSLFDMGIASDSIRSLLDPNGDFVRIAAWYYRWPWGTTPSEHETVSHLVVPLLRILGWTPQRMALEWNKMDIVLFSKLQRDGGDGRIEANVNAVVEAKRVWSPCLSWAVSQGEGYAKPLANCHRLIVSDGLRYGVFTRRRADEEFSKYAYLNLTRPRAEYPIYECKGAREAIVAMTPEWRPDWQ